MKLSFKVLLIIILTSLSNSILAQTDLLVLNKKEVKEVIYSVQNAIIANYVDLDLGKKMSESLNTKNYYSIKNPNEFAQKLTNDLQFISKDKHLKLNFEPERIAQNKIKTSELILSILWVLTGYYFVSTTVHPWYVVSLLLLSIFTTYKFARVWSYTLIFSYFAYNQFSVDENGLMLWLEYLPVWGVLVWELWSQRMLKKLKHH